MSNNMNVYACGGAAINIVSTMLRYADNTEHGYSKLCPFFIDTSASNITDAIPADKTYLLDGVDGSGKVRKSNYKALNDCSNEILHKLQPSIVNIVVHSASGGTGSVIGTLLVNELLSRGEDVIVLTVGSTGSKIEIENTVKTLKSYEVISTTRERPVVLFYRENSREKKRLSVDKEVTLSLALLAVMFSGDNKELDTSDLSNFLNYQKVTSYTSRLSMLDFYSGEINLDKGCSLVSVSTLIDAEVEPELNLPVEYQAVGFITENSVSAMDVELPIHSGVSVGYFTKVVSRLEELLETYNEVRNVVVDKTIKVDETEHTKEGIVL